MFGIDVSHHNGSIDWAKVAKEKEFAILKCSQGATYKDSKFDEYYKQAKDFLPLGCYIYNVAKDIASAEAEARFAVKCLNGKKMPYGVWLDMEDSSIKNVGKAMLTMIILAEAEILKNAGYNAGIYCNRDWYVNVLDSAKLKKDFPFWIARYPANDDGLYHKDSNISTASYSAMWQYSECGIVAGIKGKTDVNVAFEDITKLWKPVEEKIIPKADVKKLQNAMIDLGFTGKDGQILTANGKLDVNTKYALEKFCKWYLGE